MCIRDSYDAEGGIKKIVAIGNVRIKQKDRIVLSDKAIFANKEKKVILTGNPRIWQGEDMISGEKIIVFLDQDRIIIEGNKKNRVKAIITPKAKKNKSIFNTMACCKSVRNIKDSEFGV